MGFIDRMLKKSLFIKLMILIIIAILPTVFIGGIFNYISYSNMKQLTIKNIETSKDFKFSALDSQVNDAIKAAGNVVNNQNLITLILNKEYSYEVANKLINLQSQLAIIKSTIPVIDNIVIYIPQVSKTVDAISGIDDLNNKEYNDFLNYSKSNGNRIKAIDERLFFLINYAMNALEPSQTSDTRQIIISVEFSKSVMKNKILEETIEKDKVGSFLVINNYLLSDTKSKKVSTEIYEEIKNIENLNINSTYLKQYVVFGDKSDITDMKYYTYISKEMFTGSYNYYTLILIAIIVLFIVFLFLSAKTLKKVIVTPINELIDSFSRIQNGDLNFELKVSTDTYEFEYLYDYFNKTLESMRDLLDEVYEDGIRLKNAEYKQLSYQIEPHFLYNSLHIIHSMSKNEDYEGIENMSEHLRAYFKFLTTVTRSINTVKAEIEHVNNYIAIQDIRFGNRIKVKINEVPYFIANIEIPHLSLQPLIENIYTHGLKNKLSDGFCNVSFDFNDENVYIIVEDNGEDLQDDDLEKIRTRLAAQDDNVLESIALVNIHRRFQIKYGKEFGIEVSRSKLGGLKISLKLHFEKGGEEIV